MAGSERLACVGKYCRADPIRHADLRVRARPAEQRRTDDNLVSSDRQLQRTGNAYRLVARLIAAGLKRLIELNLIAATGSNQNRVYLIFGNGKRWFKLPCLALFEGGKITPFRRLTLRSKLDLHAMKLYLYFASARDNQRMFSMASHATIHAKTGIPESDVRRAHSLLTSIGP
jgi:hypothetical protein